jgi:hypothetical protein
MKKPNVKNIADKVGWGRVKPPPQNSKFGILYLVFVIMQAVFWLSPILSKLTNDSYDEVANSLSGKVFVCIFIISLIFPIFMTVKTIELYKENKMSASIGLLMISKLILLPFIIILSNYIISVLMLSTTFFAQIGVAFAEHPIFFFFFIPFILPFALFIWGTAGIVLIYIVILTIILSFPMILHLQVLRKNKVINFVQQFFFTWWLLLPGIDYFVCLFLLIGKSRKYIISYNKMPDNSTIENRNFEGNYREQ